MYLAVQHLRELIRQGQPKNEAAYVVCGVAGLTRADAKLARELAVKAESDLEAWRAERADQAPDSTDDLETQFA
jgi:hypothetical protein